MATKMYPIGSKGTVNPTTVPNGLSGKRFELIGIGGVPPFVYQVIIKGFPHRISACAEHLIFDNIQENTQLDLFQ
jgi:hypothetical protein